MAIEQHSYESFGQQLKKIRLEKKSSIYEVSSAVEIKPTELTQMEAGQLRPTQEIVGLLINHFNLAETEASQLWRLAGYDQQMTFDPEAGAPDSDNAVAEIEECLEDIFAANKQRQVLFALNDNRVIYTDIFSVRTGNNGVVLNFSQGTGDGNEAIVVARVGMSLNNAAALANVIFQSLQKWTPKSNDQPEPTQSSK